MHISVQESLFFQQLQFRVHPLQPHFIKLVIASGAGGILQRIGIKRPLTPVSHPKSHADGNDTMLSFAFFQTIVTKFALVICNSKEPLVGGKLSASA